MPDKAHAIIELTGTANHPDEPLEAAEAFKSELGENSRIVVVEAGRNERKTLLERLFEDSGGGWVQIGHEANPGEDYVDAMKNTVNEMGANVRLIYDYTNDRFALEQWVEPEWE